MSCTIGDKFKINSGGTVEVIKYNKASDVIVRFEHGGETSVQLSNLKRGSVFDKLTPSVCGVGFIGFGEYKSKGDSFSQRCYNIWGTMFHRCYSQKSLKKYPTYFDCYVCEEWHNFQNFAKWYKENYPADGGKYDLDKDIKKKGNRIYGPEFCLFVSHEQNSQEASAKRWVFISPQGMVVNIYNLSKFCAENGLHQSLMRKVNSGIRSHHRGWTKFNGHFTNK